MILERGDSEPLSHLSALHREFEREGRIRVRNVLAPSVADAAALEVAGLTYQEFCATGQGIAVIDPADMARWDAHPGRTEA